MPLSHLQIIALGLMKDIGPQSILKISKYIINNNIQVETTESLHSLLRRIEEENLISRFPHVERGSLDESFIKAEKIISNSKKENIGIITYYDDAYPSILRNTVNASGTMSPPCILYYKGDINTSMLPGIAIIGTREPTPEGIIGGEFLSSEFAKRGFNIVSGLAVGCDTVAHKGALRVGGKTTAFLAHGLDMVYPSENKQLAREILDSGGLLMSEYYIGEKMNRYNLVARDRLQAGLSLATIVIQTGEEGGTMHAANATLKAKKPLYAMWFKDEFTRQNEKVAGNHKLVQEGAEYIKGDSDINEIAEYIKEHKVFKTNLFD